MASSLEDLKAQYAVEREFKICSGRCGKHLFDRRRLHISDLIEICPGSINRKSDVGRYLCHQCFKETVFTGKCCLCNLMYRNSKTSFSFDCVSGITDTDGKQYCIECLEFHVDEIQSKDRKILGDSPIFHAKNDLSKAIFRYTLTTFVYGTKTEKIISSVKEIINTASVISQRIQKTVNNDELKKIYEELMNVPYTSPSEALDIIDSLPKERITEMTEWGGYSWSKYFDELKKQNEQPKDLSNVPLFN